MMSGLKSDCRKFSPNVFNKSKCQNCFRTKESHSAEALENNRASRNVSKCGYLFVAPDWDFNVSVNRTKRWQRRWFVLYDDGELTYALDEFPDTIPQGTIDMNKVLDVSDAEGITGNDFAISITTPDKVHFIKGTSKEESKWWFDVLCRVSPRHMSRAKHKRNATFPCGKATIPTPAVITQEYCCEDDMRLNSFSRPKFLSTSSMAQNWLPAADIEDEDVFAGRESSPYILDSNSNNKTKRDVEVHNALNKLISLPEDAFNEPDIEISAEIVIEKAPKDYLSELEESENRRRNRRYLKRENRIQRNQRSRNDGVSKMIPSKTANKSSPDSQQNSNASAIAAAEKLEYLESIHTKNDRGSFTKKDVITENEISDTLVTKIVKKPVTKTNLRKSESLKNLPTEMESEMKDHVSGLRRYHSFKGSSSHRKIKSSSGTSSLKRTKSTATGLPRETSTPIKKSQGALCSSPRPCSTIPPTTNASYENVNEDTFTRTGWLMRQTLTKDWSKHWFVLKDSSLTYYRDPSAEHSGIMDGILDLNQVSTIRDMESDKYYAICLRMWDGKKHVLAAETEEFRNIWIQALQYASNLWSSASKEDFICTEIVLPEHNFHQNDRMERISSPSSLLSLSYAEEENHDDLDCSSYSSDEQSEYFSLVDEDEISDLSSSPRTLPPSPPINRNVISLVKEKSRTRCNHGSKMNSSTSTCSEVMCDYKNMKNTETTHYQDVCQKQQDNIPVIRDEDTGVFFDDHIISDDYMPTSPITPPVEFMNSNTFPVTEKSSNHEESQKKIDVSVSDIKTGDSKECSMCSTIRSRLAAAQEEIRKLEKELKEAHTSFDNLEMFSYKLTQDMKLREDNYNSQIALMTSKIDDLTSKFTFAEKNYRQLKQKTQKGEGKERRRSSLKAREGLSLTKEYEIKLCDLENKMQFFESSLKKEPYEADESERSLSQCSSRLSEIGNGTSESSETHTPTEAVCNENKSFFSRLQSLIAKVENVNSVFSPKSETTVLPNNPKICLPSKITDDLNSSYELDEWRTQSPGDVSQNSENYCQNLINYPKTLSECQTMLSQKLNNHFEWLKYSLESIYENKIESAENEQQFLRVHNLSRELNDLNCEIIPNNLVEQKYLLLSEVVKALKSIDTYQNVNFILKTNIVKNIYKTIFHTMCTTFAEYEYSDFPHVFITTVPQFNFFCPSSNIFSTKSSENSTHLNLSDRLGLLETQFDDTLASLKHAKLVRYESLWNILAEVPVQDDPVNKPVEVDSILRCTTSLAIDIHRIAEFQLTNVPKLSQFSSKTEQDFMHQLYKDSHETLQSNVTTFLDELREKCPMINECTVSFYKLNESTRNNIMHLVVELSFLNICITLLKLLVEYFKTIDKKNQTLNDDKFLLREKWLYFISRSNNGLDSSFCCSHCKVVNDLVHESEDNVDWSEYVKNHSYFHVRNFNKNLTIDSTSSSETLMNSCTNCDTKLSAKGQKDICNNVTCSQCDSWIQKFCSSEKQHEIELRTLETKCNAEIKQLEECIIKSSEMHEQEMLQKQNELLALTLQLQRLKTEYEEQKQMLRNFYEEKLNFECDSINEESIKDIYRAEIEDLKGMFKEGLVAIENSHSRITSEMERRHKEEVSLLEAEKQKALELEAQATLTALEAIKKSHAQQLIEQTSVIKKELMNKYHKGEEYLNLYNKYGNELETMKKEILKITDLYSSKCIENVDLEGKLNCLRQQLKEANNELSNLLCKNKEITSNLCIKT